MGDPQQSAAVPLDPRMRLLKPARMVLDQYALAEAGEKGADNTDAGRMAQRIEDAIGHSVTDVQPTAEWQERVAAWEAAITRPPVDEATVARVLEWAADRLAGEWVWGPFNTKDRDAMVQGLRDLAADPAEVVRALAARDEEAHRG